MLNKRPSEAPQLAVTLLKAESHPAVGVCVTEEYRICVICSMIRREIKPVLIFLPIALPNTQNGTVHNGSMDLIAAYGTTLDASRQMCFGFNSRDVCTKTHNLDSAELNVDNKDL